MTNSATDSAISPALKPAPPQTGGVITQTLAIFHDAYRELNARKMFWIVLILSILAVGVFAMVSVTPTSIKVLSYEIDTGFVPSKSLYKSQFSNWVIGVWLSWAAVILALISTASIFPDFITSGSVDLFISKPLSRIRLFFTKYAAGMLFVFLQVAVFAVLTFFVFGVRGHIWEPRLFWMIPIVMCFFSYLFAVSVFLGVLMRSTLAALLFTILFWFFVFLIHWGEVSSQVTINMSQQNIADIDDSLAEWKTLPTPMPATTRSARSLTEYLEAPARSFGLSADAQSQRKTELLAEREREVKTLQWYKFWHGLIFPVQVVVPKTTETIGLLYNSLLSKDEFDTIMESGRMSAIENHRGRRAARLNEMEESDQITRSRTLWWSLGSSLCFEAVVILLAAWLFCRRDY